MEAKIRTIDVQAKEWFDKVNGNSYFSADVTLNFGLKSQRIISLPFQYGYGSHFEHMAFKAIKEQVNRKELKACDNTSYWRFCDDNGIVWRSSKRENCLKKELTQ